MNFKKMMQYTEPCNTETEMTEGIAINISLIKCLGSYQLNIFCTYTIQNYTRLLIHKALCPVHNHYRGEITLVQ
jgi:hypothetical protein